MLIFVLSHTTLCRMTLRFLISSKSFSIKKLYVFILTLSLWDWTVTMMIQLVIIKFIISYIKFFKNSNHATAYDDACFWIFVMLTFPCSCNIALHNNILVYSRASFMILCCIEVYLNKRRCNNKKTFGRFTSYLNSYFTRD